MEKKGNNDMKNKMSVEEIQNKIYKIFEAISVVKKSIGHGCFSEEGNARIEALDCAIRCLEFAETTEEFIKNVEEADVEENIKELVKRFIKHGLNL